MAFICRRIYRSIIVIKIFISINIATEKVKRVAKLNNVRIHQCKVMFQTEITLLSHIYRRVE